MARIRKKKFFKTNEKGGGPQMKLEKLYEDNFISVLKDSKSGWRFCKVTDAAAILVYIKDLDSVLLISQKRPAMVSEENPEGVSVELVAGRIDYEVSVKQLLVNELEEEAGVRTSVEQIQIINFGHPVSSSAGHTTEKKYLGYVEVHSSQIEDINNLDRIFGNEHESEKIKRIIIKTRDLKNTTFTGMAIFALVQWFLLNIYNDKGGGPPYSK